LSADGGQYSDNGPLRPLVAGRFEALDSLRGVAAVIVMFFHFGDFGLISGLRLVRAGPIFVDFFFVLSGFVITAAYGERLAHGFSRVTFMLLRLGRLYPLQFAVVAAFAAAKLASGRALFGGSHGGDYLARAFLMLDGYVPNDPNVYNLASWSTSVELAAYLMAALLFGRGRFGYVVAGAIWLLALSGYLAGLNGPVFTDMLQRCLIGFGLGVTGYAAYRRYSAIGRLPTAGAAEGLALLLAASLVALLGDDGWRLLACDLSFMLAIMLFAYERGFVTRILLTGPMKALGRWSYSIYMIHLLVITVVSQVLTKILARLGRYDILRPSGTTGFDGIDLGLWWNTALTLVVAAACIALASQTYRLIEAPGRQWARREARLRGAPDAERTAPTI
jgi:peptidoglycan/LPS O-acetylase OafA/YrhL